jgi:apolipoprotein N-acyltransferase
LKVFLKNAIILSAAGILSGIALFAAFPPYGLSFLAWVAMVPLLLTTAAKKPLVAFWVSWIWGCTFFLGIFTWILMVARYTYLHHAILIIYLGFYFAVFGVLYAVVSKNWGLVPASIAAPFIWITLEYIRSNLSFMALPWGLLAHSQYENTLIIQAAAVAGTAGVGFLIVAVNAAITLLLFQQIERLRVPGLDVPARIPPKKSTLTVGAVTAVLVAGSIFYGYSVISNPVGGKTIKVAVVQGNIEQWQKWDKKFAPLILSTYRNLTMTVAQDKPDLIIWPETATPKAINADPRLKKEVRKIAETAGTSLLIGSSQVYKFKKNDSKSAKVKNSAYLVPADPGLKISQQYAKILLFPFGEYLPYKKKIPWAYIDVPDVGNYIRGEDLTVFELPGCKFGVTICWENLFSNFVRQFVKNGAQFIVNLTNEAWFGRTGAPYQFVSMNVFRAVENRVYLIRCTNTGISCFIDPHGRIVNTVKDKKGREIFIRGVASSSITPLESDTIYTRFGDWFIGVSVAIVIAMIIYSFVKSIFGVGS